MRYPTAVAILLGFALISRTSPAGADNPRIFPYDVHAETLDNGLHVVLVPMSAGGLMAYWHIVKTGSRDEYEPGRTGFAHFFEHMMFRGTEKVPAEEFNAFVTEIGADANAFTSDDLTGYYLSIAAEDMERVMEIESDRFQNLSYPLDMFQTEAGAVYGEYRKNRANPFFVINEALHEAAFEKHTYGHSAMGYEEDIKVMPDLYDYSKSFFKRYYRPENVILLIAGDLEVDSAMEKVRHYYGGWERGYRPPEIPTEPPQEAERRIDVKYEGRSLPIVWMGYKSGAFDPSDRDYVATSLFADLAFGQTSEIYKKLVIDEQVVDVINAGRQINRDPKLFSVIARIKDPAKVDYVIGEIDSVLAAAGETPPETTRLAELKSRLKYQFLMNLDTPMNVAGALSRYLAVAGDHLAIDRYFETADTITAEEVRDAVKKIFMREKRTVAVLRGEG